MGKSQSKQCRSKKGPLQPGESIKFNKESDTVAVRVKTVAPMTLQTMWSRSQPMSLQQEIHYDALEESVNMGLGEYSGKRERDKEKFQSIVKRLSMPDRENVKDELSCVVKKLDNANLTEKIVVSTVSNPMILAGNMVNTLALILGVTSGGMSLTLLVPGIVLCCLATAIRGGARASRNLYIQANVRPNARKQLQSALRHYDLEDVSVEDIMNMLIIEEKTWQERLFDNLVLALKTARSTRRNVKITLSKLSQLIKESKLEGAHIVNSIADLAAAMNPDDNSDIITMATSCHHVAKTTVNSTRRVGKMASNLFPSAVTHARYVASTSWSVGTVMLPVNAYYCIASISELIEVLEGKHCSEANTVASIIEEL